MTDSFVCPVCGAESSNPNDAAAGYCGRCHDWTGHPTPYIAKVAALEAQRALDAHVAEFHAGNEPPKGRNPQ